MAKVTCNEGWMKKWWIIGWTVWTFLWMLKFWQSFQTNPNRIGSLPLTIGYYKSWFCLIGERIFELFWTEKKREWDLGLRITCGHSLQSTAFNDTRWVGYMVGYRVFKIKQEEGLVFCLEDDLCFVVLLSFERKGFNVGCGVIVYKPGAWVGKGRVVGG